MTGSLPDAPGKEVVQEDLLQVWIGKTLWVCFVPQFLNVYGELYFYIYLLFYVSRNSCPFYVIVMRYIKQYVEILYTVLV